MSLLSAFVKKQFEPLIKGVVIRFLSMDDLRSLKIPVPRLSEQKKAVKKIRDLRRKVAQLDEKKKTIQSQITEIVNGLSG
jgi:restriction endonuclease S subunit